MNQQTISSRYSPGDIFDERYKIVKVLGMGGMAEVYLVEDTKRDNRQYALKLLMPHISNDPVNVERFKREILIMESLESPYIVKSHYYEVSKKNEHFIIMEYVEGQSLSKILKDTGRIDYNLVYAYLIQILQGLKAAHDKGFIHRDIKPDNIMLTSDNKIKIADFGIAKDLNTNKEITELANAAASVHYKAPELYNDKYDHTVDFYSLGITVYELLTNTKPFDAEKNIQILMQHQTKEIPQLKKIDSSIPDFFQEFVEILSEKTPQKRFKNSDDALKFLNNFKKEISGGDFADYLISNLNYSFIEKRPWLKKYIRKANKFFSGVFLKYAVSVFVGVFAYILYMPLNKNLDLSFIGDSIDLALLDKQFQVRGPLKKPKDILIISIDEASYQHYGFSFLEPWPRDKIAELFEFISDKEARLIITDFAYPKDPKYSNPERDKRLADAFAKNPTVLSKFFNPKQNKGKSSDEFEYIDSDPLFIQSAKAVYNANLIDTGKVRYFNTGKGTNRGIPPMAELLLGDKVASEPYPSPYDMINYVGPPGEIEHFSFYKVLTDPKYNNKKFFKDKIIFLGQQLFLGYEKKERDTFITPVSNEYMSGVEIHANTASNVLYKNWIKRLPLDFEGLIIFFSAIVISYLLLSVNLFISICIILSLIILWIVISYYAFISNMFFPGLVLLLVVLLTAIPVRILSYYFAKKREEKVLGMG